jgi:hypothetical protein
MAMNAQLVTMAIGLGLSQVARRIDLDTPERLWGIRALYFATQVIVILIYLYIAAKVSYKQSPVMRQLSLLLKLSSTLFAFWPFRLPRFAERTIIPFSNM